MYDKKKRKKRNSPYRKSGFGLGHDFKKINNVFKKLK